MPNTQVAIGCVKRLQVLETALRDLRDAAKRYGEAQFFDGDLSLDDDYDEDSSDAELDSSGAAMIRAIEAADAVLGDA
jgi:NAD(P)H-dependent FMN reductase